MVPAHDNLLWPLPAEADPHKLRRALAVADAHGDRRLQPSVLGVLCFQADALGDWPRVAKLRIPVPRTIMAAPADVTSAAAGS